MNRRRTITAVLCICAAGAFTLDALKPAPLAVDVLQNSILVGDTRRSARIVVPSNLSENAPVVFAFHGIGDSPDSMATYSQLDQLANEHGFLLVYPAGRNAMWSAINVDADRLDANPDVRFFDALLKRIASQYKIDRDRIYLVGMSNGASFVQILANARSTEIAGVLAHSGPRPRALRDAKTPFPIVLIVGGDDLAEDAMRSDLEYYQASGHHAELIVVEGVGHSWATQGSEKAWSFLVEHQRQTH